MSEAEERMLTGFAAEIVGTTQQATTPAPAAAAAPVETAKKGGRRTAKPAAAAKAKSKMHACAVCGKPFARKTSEQTCSPACREIRKQRQKADWKLKPTAQAAKQAPAAAGQAEHKCRDCGTLLDNPKKIVCNPCASKRLRDIAGA
jgi:rubrerythrin